MTPAPPLVYKCPYCGTLKTICALGSGNTCGATCWSDFKQDLPMLPRASLVQQCPSCNKYFLNTADNFYKCAVSYACGASWGYLSYPSLKDAFVQLSPLGDNEFGVRLMLLHSYNDLYGGCKGTKDQSEVSAEEKKFFIENARALIKLCNIKDPAQRLLMAELYREMGQFHKATRILRAAFKYDDDGLIDLCNKILLETDERNSKVFIYYGDKNHRRESIKRDDEGYVFDEELDAKNKIEHVEDDLPF